MTSKKKIAPKSKTKPKPKTKLLGAPKKVRKHKQQRKATKIDRPKVKLLAEKGVAVADIAQHQGVVLSTVYRFLNEIGIDNKALEEFKSKRSDVFALQGLKGAQLIDRYYESWGRETDEEIDAKTDEDKKKVVHTIQGGVKYVFDQELTERGLRDVKETYEEIDEGHKVVRRRIIEIRRRLGEDTEVIDIDPD